MEGIFISSPGKEEEDTAEWINGLAMSFQAIAAVTVPTVQAPENSNQPRTRGYTIIKHTSSMLTGVAPKRLWSVQFALKSIPGVIKVKPDLIFCASDPLSKASPTWMEVMSFMEVMSRPNDLNMTLNLARKAYAVFMTQPGRRFLMAVSISAQVFHLHIYNCSGVIHSLSYNIHTHADVFSKLIYFFYLHTAQSPWI